MFGSDFGGRGLIKMPSALTYKDGSLVATISQDRLANIYAMTYQATPWLETTFRYSIFNPQNLSSSSDFERDRSYGAKLRLINEGKWLPHAAIGVRDLLGTGLLEGEYLVGTKNIKSLQITLGMGWGRLAGNGPIKSPLALLGSDFEYRPDRGASGGGSVVRADLKVISEEMRVFLAACSLEFSIAEFS